MQILETDYQGNQSNQSNKNNLKPKLNNINHRHTGKYGDGPKIKYDHLIGLPVTPISEIFYHPVYHNNTPPVPVEHDTQCVSQLTDGATTRADFAFYIPKSFTAIVEMKVIWRSDASSGNMIYQSYTKGAAIGESYSTHANNMGASTSVATLGGDLWNALDLGDSSHNQQTGFTGGDYITISFKRYGADVNDTLNNQVYVLGLLVKYK